MRRAAPGPQHPACAPESCTELPEAPQLGVLLLVESFPVLCSKPTQKGFSLKYFSGMGFFPILRVGGMDGYNMSITVCKRR